MGVDLATQWWVFILFGVGAGFMSSLFGIGGGVIMMPLLLLVAGGGGQFTVHEARLLALGYMVLTCLAGALATRGIQKVDVSIWVIALLTVGGVMGAASGVVAAQRIKPVWIKRLFALLMVFAAVKMFWGTMGSGAPRGEKVDPPEVLSGPAG